MRMNIFRTLALAAVFAALPSLAYAEGPFDYYTLPPCRVVDTRNPVATNGGPALSSDVDRAFSIRGACGVPMNARAVTFNVTITGASTDGFIMLWPTNRSQPYSAGTIHFKATDMALANGAIVALGTNSPDLYASNSEGTVHLLLDVTGYFK